MITEFKPKCPNCNGWGDDIDMGTCHVCEGDGLMKPSHWRYHIEKAKHDQDVAEFEKNKDMYRQLSAKLSNALLSFKMISTPLDQCQTEVKLGKYIFYAHRNMEYQNKTSDELRIRLEGTEKDPYMYRGHDRQVCGFDNLKAIDIYDALNILDDYVEMNKKGSYEEQLGEMVVNIIEDYMNSR